MTGALPLGFAMYGWFASDLFWLLMWFAVVCLLFALYWLAVFGDLLIVPCMLVFGDCCLCVIIWLC